jgi:site-specific DNA-methyltransferase (adenine-specific)/modification methylase
MKPYYDKDGITIYNGDCLDVMQTLEPNSFDLVLTDPPYGIKMDKGFSGSDGFSGSGKPIKRREYLDNWDFERPNEKYFDLIQILGKKIIIAGGNFFADILPKSTHWIVWDKLNTMPSFGDCELFWTNLERKSVKKITLQYNGLLGKEKFRYHPTQKPVALMEYLIKTYTDQNDLILDPFMGSGTTLVAAKKLKRRAVGIELSEQYCQIAVNRLENTLDQGTLF